ncbi:acyltransferase [Parahaliea mediterranea]|uniref:LpxL/LpxP family acyltransferase n=1 Tax=Parahaliea mediterranea TaxID=651086 RepID=UPI00130078CD|nr:acyltransferase [Parahaliea mediterranea]
MTEARRWSDIREVGFVGGMRLLLWIYRHIGPWAFTLVQQPVVLYYFVVHRTARRASLEYLQRLQAASAPGTTPAPNWFNAYRHQLAFGRAAVDKLGVWADGELLQHVQFPDRPLLLEQLDSGRGAVLMGAHLGNMEICRSLSRYNRRLKLNVLVHTGNADMFNRLLRELEVDGEVELIEVNDVSPATAIRLAGCIERGEFIAILADRVAVGSRGRSQQVEFLGRPAPFPEGPFILAALLKCPVYTVFCTRGAAGYDVSCARLAERIRLPRQGRRQALNSVMQRYAATLEASVRQAPLQWFNFYPFWDQAE